MEIGYHESMHQIFRYVRTGAGLLLLAGAFAGCVKTVPYDPFKVPREQIRKEIQTIALMPIAVSSSLADLDVARERFEPSIVKRLEEAGLRVIDSSVWDELWLEVGTDIGEIYDPSTRKVDQERYDIVRFEVYRLLEANYDVDAILYVAITTVDLHMTWADRLNFCGGSAPAYWPGGWSGTHGDRATLIVAACLSASLENFDDHQLYGIRTALEIIETYAHQTRATRPRDERFEDSARNAEAVELVIGPMADNFGLPGEEEPDNAH